MDVIALAQHGISYAVAASGTATNQESLQALLKPTHHLIFCFDGDKAGYRAADRALENLLELLQDGMHIQFLMLPEGEDPDSLVRREEQDAFQQRIDEATPLSRLLFERQTQDLDLTLAEHRGELRSRVEPMLRRMPHSAMRDALWQELQRLTGRTRWSHQNDSQRTRSQPSAPAESAGQHQGSSWTGTPFSASRCMSSPTWPRKSPRPWRAFRNCPQARPLPTGYRPSAQAAATTSC